MIVRVLLMSCLAISMLFGSSFQQAEQAYKDQQYDKALSEYWALYGEYPNSSELNYNLGNVYFKLEELGKSIFYYKKALQLNPRDQETRENLEFARHSVIGLSSDAEVKPLFSFLSTITGKQLLVLSIVMVVLLNGIAFYYFFIRQSEALRNIGVSCLMLTMISLGCLVLKEGPFEIQEGVVIVKKTAIMSGPSESFKELFFVHEGYEFQELFSQGDWSKIKLSNGAIGWIRRSDYWSL